MWVGNECERLGRVGRLNAPLEDGWRRRRRWRCRGAEVVLLVKKQAEVRVAL